MQQPGTGRVGYVLKKAQHLLRLRMDEALREGGLTTPQYAVLAALEEEPGLSGAALSRRCFVTPQTMTAVVANLASAGLIERAADPDHGRIIQTRLTAAGRAALANAHRLVRDIEERMLAGLGADDRHVLFGLLTRCADALTARKTEAAG